MFKLFAVMLMIAALLGCETNGSNRRVDADRDVGGTRVSRGEAAEDWQVYGLPATRGTRAELLQAHDEFYDALNSALAGRDNRMTELWADSPDVTLMSPYGDRLSGLPEIERFFRGLAARQSGPTNVRPRDPSVYMDRSGDLGVVTTIDEVNTIDFTGRPTLLSLRGTSAFQQTPAGWRLVLHHTDVSPELRSVGGLPR